MFDDGGGYCHHCGFTRGAGGKAVKEQPTKEYTKPPQGLPKFCPDSIIQYFDKRGIPEEVLERNKVTGIGSEIMFPYFLNREIVNIKYRDLDKSFRQERNAMKVFYGIDDILGEDTVYIVEGEIDKLSCEVVGYTNVVSVPDGAPSPNTKTFNSKFEFIDNCEHLFKTADRIVIAVDNDPPGERLKEELSRRFDPEKCLIVHWKKDCTDANSVLMKYGTVALLECLDNPVPIPIEGVFTVDDYTEALESLYDNGLQGGMSTGFPQMDDFYTVRPGEMTVLTGIPSHGKSSWLSHVMCNLADIYGQRFAVYTPENQPLQRFIAALSTIKAGRPFKEGAHERMTRAQLHEAKTWVGEHFYLLQPSDEDLSVDSLLSKAKETVRRYGVNGLVLDPWNEIDHTRKSGITETEYISTSLSKIRRFARLYQVHVWVVAHPVKMMKELNKDTFPEPTAYDISGSSHWYNKADCIVCVWRNPKDDTEPVRVYVQKVRFQEVGTVGVLPFEFNRMLGTYNCIGGFQETYHNDHKKATQV